MNTSIAYNIGSDIANSILASNSVHGIIANMDTLDSLQEYYGECLENYKCHSPFEFTAKEFNESESPDDAWDAFEAGFYETIENSIDTVKQECIAELSDLIEDEQESMYENEHDTFDELLDSANDEITIGGMVFLPSQVLKECDPIAYRESYLCFLDDFESEEMERLQDIKDKVENS